MDPIVAKKVDVIKSRMQKLVGKSALFAPSKKAPAKQRRGPVDLRAPSGSL